MSERCWRSDKGGGACQALADTSERLGGSEIERLLRRARVPDPDPTNTKWKHLFNALVSEQNRVQSAMPVLNYIVNAPSNPSERSKQSGFVKVVKGLLGVFRNPVTRAARVSWPMSEDDALEFSVSHRMRVAESSRRRDVHGADSGKPAIQPFSVLHYHA